ncbi:MAG TPA: NHLP family bacteriocin export ABC transporter peptidase/permease/ATPase subunit [Chthoniobacteraceae bacterium]|nr:NHLP family bacteriocin export ABC transporter peptidase/permease/ATPase subunit [Chthoniobacteraceae bacterium]
MTPLPNRRAKTATVIQMEAVECGAAALAMVLDYHGKVIPLAQLREACGISRDGSKALHLLQAARRLGMKAKGFRYSAGELGSVPLPAVLFWDANHFVVLEGFGRGGKLFYINDPASGPHAISADRFAESYAGVVLTFEPGPAFQPGGRRPENFRFLLERMPGGKDALAFALFCTLLLAVPGVLAPVFTRIFIDDYLIGRETAWLQPLLVGMVLAMVLQMALTALQQLCLLRWRTKLALAESGRFFARMMRLPMRYFSQRFAGEIGSRLALNDAVAETVGGPLATAGLHLLLIIFFAVVMLFYSVPLTAIVLAVAGAKCAVVRLAARHRAGCDQRLMQEAGQLYGASINGLSMVETLKSSGGEDDFFARWAGYQTRVLAGRQALAARMQELALAPGLFHAVGGAAIFTFGAFAVMEGELTIGTVIAFFGLAAQLSAPVDALLEVAFSLPELESNLARVNDVMQAGEDPLYRAQRNRALFEGSGKLVGRVELRGVSFGYSPLEPPLIRDLSLTIEPGHRVALVGASGSGKSTLARLAAGLVTPWSGGIMIDGVPLTEIPRDLLATSLAMVDQELVFFSGTVRDNLSLWDATIPESDLVQAAKDAEIHDLIATRPGGYQSLLGEGGANFSGGQRQRLEIARALAGRPSILILDEATSALDPITEAAIDRNLRRRGCSTLIIAHRLSTIRDADEIVVLESGSIVERGDFESLKKAKGRFCELMEL